MKNTIMKKNTKDSKYENGQRTLKNRPGTDAPKRHPSVTAQLSNSSPYRLVPEEKKKEKRGEYKNMLSKQPTCRLFSHPYLGR